MNLHQFVLEDEKIFSDCENLRPGNRNASGLFDFSQTTLAMDENGIFMEGNVTTVWNVQPTDVVRADLSLLYFDRGSWTPTVLNIASKNLCKVLYDEKQYWYVFWFKHVKNVKDVQNNCLNNPGTILMFEPFYFNVMLGFDMPLRTGRYLITISLSALDPNGVPREDSICLAIRGDIHKITAKN
ncbi:hypothetical protein KR054_005040 [Drosophila jambulina]|nr:hypothetical protein KR054_005040 [Drosophila jambulina]